MKKVVQFNVEALYHSIMKVLELRTEPQEPDKFLLFPMGVIDLKTSSKRTLTPEFVIPQFYSYFAMKEKLYICGGSQEIDEKVEELNTFFTSDGEGKCDWLAPMSEGRSSVSLCGVGRQILALGGWNNGCLSKAEQYFVEIDKWTALPSLTIAR